jgi:hypothetical protein
MFLEFHLDSKPYRDRRLLTSILGKDALPESEHHITVLPTYDARTSPGTTVNTRSLYPVLFGSSCEGPFTLRPQDGISQKAFSTQLHLTCGKTPMHATDVGFFDGDLLFLNPDTSNLVHIGSTVSLT